MPPTLIRGGQPHLAARTFPAASKPSTGRSQPQITLKLLAGGPWQAQACTGTPPRRPQNQHTRWPAADRTRAPPNQLHKRHTQRAEWASTRALPKRVPLVGSAAAPQLAHCSQPEGQSHPQTQLQQEGTHIPHQGPPGAPGTGDQGYCATGPHRTPPTHSAKTGRHSSST